MCKLINVPTLWGCDAYCRFSYLTCQERIVICHYALVNMLIKYRKFSNYLTVLLHIGCLLLCYGSSN